jgi:hypothetical protein
MAKKGTRSAKKKKSTPASSSRRTASFSARAAAGGETIDVGFDLRDVSGLPIRDPETVFTFRRVSDNRQIGDQLRLALTGATVRFSLPVATGEVDVCEIDPKRYRFAHSPLFFRTPGPPIRKESQLLREPKEWQPEFTDWDDLSPTFEDLKRVLGDSQGVTLFKEGSAIADHLVEDAYDDMAGDRVVLAKTALLNTYFRLNETTEPVSDSRTWFSFVSRIIAIGRERFLALVDPAMETLVAQIHQHIDLFRGEYERTPAENHRGNVPVALQSRITRMISIKSSHAKGNFQLTLTHLSSPDEVLLDADIDENGELLGHIGDLFKHKINGGTHPHDVHEILVLQEGDKPEFDLGYELV